MTKYSKGSKYFKVPKVNLKPLKDRQARQGAAIADLRIRIIVLEAMVSRLAEEE